MSRILALTGNESAAEAMRQINPDVVAAYPITPQTELMHKFAEFHGDGLVDTELVLVESEHSAMSATVGAAAGGARSMTATSANGLALMWEIVYIAASLRLPIVMPVINRALSGNINIHCDHSDTMGCRDSGWIQIFSENCQEAYDNTLMAVKIAETKEVLLPVMVTLDGFILSHTIERLEALEDEEVKSYVGEYVPEYSLLDVESPITVGPLDLQDYYFEHKRKEIIAEENALPVIENVSKEFGKLSGRSYDLIEEYKMENADTAIIAMGSTAGTAKVAIDALRERGEKVGLIKIRCFRPFPYARIIDALSKVKAVGVLDRAVSFGALGGPVYGDIRSAMFSNNGHHGVKIVDYIYGLGGRDIELAHFDEVAKDLSKIAQTNTVDNEVSFLGLRE